LPYRAVPPEVPRGYADMFFEKKTWNFTLKSVFLLWYFELKIVLLFWEKTQEFPAEIVLPVLVF